MPYTEWVNPDYEVQVDYVVELKQEIDDYGYIQRAFGISKGVFALLSNIHQDVLMAELEACVILGETTAKEALDIIFEEDEHKEYANYSMEAYYPTVMIEAEFDDGLAYEVHVCVNQREKSVGYHKRFICILTEEEIETYRRERV